MDPRLRTDRTRVRRLPDRGRYDRPAIDNILDAGFVCHLGFVANGQPYVIPTGYARSGDRVYIHGSAASRLVRALGAGVDVCLTVTLVEKDPAKSFCLPDRERLAQGLDRLRCI